MIMLLKLLAAHFIGDFLLQPKSWVKGKERDKLQSPKLYLHILIHGALLLLVLGSWDYWVLVLLLTVSHGLIDVLKIYFQNDRTKTKWFLIDQGLHLISIFTLWAIWFNPDINHREWLDSTSVWIYFTALLFLTVVSGILIQVLMSGWSKAINDSNEASLNSAGKYIGILERLFVFTFIVLGRWEAIGFLLAAKSIFRFGDLKESKDRKLTEYILIGTLLSFAIATAVGLLVVSLLSI